MRKILALVLSLLVIVAGLPFTAFAETSAATNELDGKAYTIGTVLYQNNFESENLDVLPEGWEVGIAPYLWNGGGSVSAKVAEGSGNKFLSVGFQSTDGLVSGPTINTRNYMFEADVTISAGYVGTVNNMAGGVSNSQIAVINRISPEGSTHANVNFSKQKAGVSGYTERAITLPGENPAIGETFKVKIISFEGKSYFYYNDVLAFSYNNVLAENKTDCIGFFGCNSWFKVDNVVIKAVNKVSEAKGFSYAETLDAEIGEEIINHDYSSMNAKPAEITGDATLSATSAVNNENTLTFSNWWSAAGRNAKISVGTEKFAAKVTMVVDNVQTQNIGGTFAFRSVGKNASDTEEIASYIRIGLPDRTAGAPNPGNIIYYNENAQWGFTEVSGVTPFTTDSGIETFTFYVYSLNGVNYYVKEDNTLIAASTHKVGITDASTIELFVEYGIVYVTDLVVYELKEKEKVNVIDALEETTGFSRENEVVNVDFSEIATGSTPNGWTLSAASVGAGSSDSASRNVLRLNNNTGASSASFNVSTSNFVAVVNAGIDYAQTLAGTLIINIYDPNGTRAAYWGIGLPKRSESQVLKAGKSVVSDLVGYYYPAAGAYEYSTTGYTNVTMILYCYEGTIYCYWPDGTFVYSLAVNSNADLSNGATISLGNDWATAYIHDISVYSITPYVPPFESGLVENSGFIADAPLYNMDFATAATGTNLEGWTFTSSSIGTGSSESASRNVLRLNNNTGYTNAHYTLPVKNFAATVTIGIDYAQQVIGSFVFGVKDANGTLAASWAVGLPKRSESQTLKAGKSCISDNKNYYYPAAGAYEYIVDGYTTLKMAMYLYDGIFYFFWEDGTFVYKIPASSACDLNAGNLQLYLANDWGCMYVHDVKLYEIIPNTLKVDAASLSVNNNEPVVNFNLSYNDSLKDVVSAEDMEFGAVVTINNNAVTTDTTVDTDGATIWELEKGANVNDIFNFSKEYAVTNDIADKYINVRTFVKNGEMYSYGDAVSYCPAQLADIFYRSTQNSDEKAVIEDVFASSNVFLGKNSKKTTFTVFSDFHYIEGMYISSIADMNEIFDRAYENGSSFVLSAGDMCNDIKGSPELINALLNNKYGLTAANVYGNHELEGPNSMEIVTPTLTNAQNVVWGTANGSYDSSIGYYYFEKDGFRIICTDTNYSWDPTNQIWEHNTTWSYGPPSGNTNINALGPVQLAWLQSVLDDAVEKDIPCIVMSHASLNTGWGEQSYDAATTQKMFEEANKANPNTVMMHISGHSHDDRIENINGIVYMRCNTTRNGYWKAAGTDHYTEEDTFMKETYDENGNFLGYVETPIGSLNGGKNTHFFKDPVSAVVTIDECGIITIDGSTTTWLNDVNPDLTGVSEYIRPTVSDYASFSCENGHIWDYTYDEYGNIVYDECMNPDCNLAILNGKEVYKVSNYVYDNESYKVKFNYSANSFVKLGFFVADKQIADTVGYIEGENTALYTANGNGSAEILLTVDKKNGSENAVGEQLYMYVIDGNASDIEISALTYEKLTNANGGALVSNKGVSILNDLPEHEKQAMRYYFSYDTTTGSDIIIDGKSYTVKSRGFLFANGDNVKDSIVSRETAKNGNIIDMNVSENLTTCWSASQNGDLAKSTNLWFSTYVKGFASENGTYNNTNKLYVKGYVVVEANGVEFTLYGKELNMTVSEVAALN